MKSILFVDDEANVLRGLKRMLYPFADVWRTEFAGNGAEALAMLEKGAFDLIVADMRMPGLDGAQLLTEVAQRYPQMMRMILSGSWEHDLRMQAALSAHQYLSKPCSPEVLKATLDRAFALREVLVDPALRKLISGTSSLPSAPSIYLELIEALKRPEVSVEDVAAVLTRDAGMAAKVLQLVNSAAFGCRRHITNLEDAVIFLGIESIKALALSVSAFSMFDTRICPHFSIGHFEEHSGVVASLARAVAKSRNVPKPVIDDTFVAGLLHDVGKLILVSNYPEKYDCVLEEATSGVKTLTHAERGAFSITHAEAGSYLLSMWGLPDNVVEAVAFHHNPSKCPDNSFGPLAAVHIADVLEQEITHEITSATPVLETSFDAAYLARIQVADELPAWESLAREQLGAG